MGATLIDKAAIREWMESELENNWQDYDDPDHVAGNLAEKAIDKFLDGDGPLADLDAIWAEAFEIAEEYNADNEEDGESWGERNQDYWRTVTRGGSY